MVAKFLLLPILSIGTIALCWIINMTKLTECDFNAPYKCEAVHAIGILPPASLVTVWFDTDE